MATKSKSKWGSKLKKIKSGWADSEQSYKEMFGASDLPEDVYVMKLQTCELSESATGNLRIKRSHVVIEGDYKGVVVPDGLNLEGELKSGTHASVFVRRWLEMLDIEVPDDPEDIEGILEEIQDANPVVKARITHSGDFTNVNLVSVIDDDAGEEGESESEDGEGELTQEILDAMDKNEMRELVKENDLDIKKYRTLDEDSLRSAIADLVFESSESNDEKSSGDGEAEQNDGDGDGEVDLDALDKKGLLSLIEENEISAKELGFANKIKMKNSSENAIRKALEDALGGEGGDDTVDDDAILEQAKIFCSTWDIPVSEDADIEDIKSAISECEFPEVDVDEDEILLLGTLDLTGCIK